MHLPTPRRSLISFSLALMRSVRDSLMTRNRPARVFLRMNVKPRKLKVSGLPCPRLFRSAGCPESAEFDEARLVLAQRQRKLPQACRAARNIAGQIVVLPRQPR